LQLEDFSVNRRDWKHLDYVGSDIWGIIGRINIKEIFSIACWSV